LFYGVADPTLPATWWRLGVGGGSLRLGREENLQNRTRVSAGYTASHAKLLVSRRPFSV